jgi:crotonobetainyl-CoA:carnitine CoA-transferase CaiB-like acyl-CoA transferase
VTSESLLDGLHVLDLAGEPAQMAARILGDLGAEVARVECARGGRAVDRLAWDAGKRLASIRPDDDALGELLAAADIVIDTPGWPGAPELDPARAPGAVWVSVTPFGRTGPRSAWRASDLGVMASTGNMYSTGDADRPPVRCTEPTAYAHTGPEAAFAALTGVASGRPQRVDLSMQEVVLVASMGAAGRFARTGFRGRRSGSAVGRTREIWPCADGFVSFGLRGGKARVPNLQLITRLLEDAGLGDPALSGRDWTAYNHNTVTDDELRAIEAPIARYFAERTMTELYEIACDTNLMLAPANSPRELYASRQLEARGFFGPYGDVGRFPLSFVQVRGAAPVGPRPQQPHAPPFLSRSATPTAVERDKNAEAAAGRAWTGTKILEFGSGAAGPIATRYFAEHGATVIKVESRTRPDFLRTYAISPNNPHGLEGGDMFDALNVGKLGITLNMKHPRGIEIAKRLAFEWCDAVTENFAPKAMRAFGMDYDTLAVARPDLVMLSACLQGQTGPHRDYPGFGGQGAALSGYNILTGWPDRDPLGPYATITDSLAPRFAAAALAAALLYRRRTGRGVYLDLSQVECAAWSLSPWLLDYETNGRVTIRNGNASDRATVHGVFPCSGDDRWVAIAAWDTEEAERLAKVTGDDLEAWTRARSAGDAARTLQAAGIEAVPVADFGDVYADEQLAHRGHFVRLTHPFMGDGAYERNGFHLSDASSGYTRTSPTLGQDNADVLGGILGLSAAEQEQLADEGALD